MMRAADHVIDMGPGAGMHGGRVMAQGTFDAGEGHARLAHRPVPGGALQHCRAQAPHRLAAHASAQTVQQGQGPAALRPARQRVRRAEREAQHIATLGELQALKVIGASGNNLQERRRRRSRWACSPASPASRARANRPWSTTRCTRPWRARSTAPTTSRRRTRPSRASSISTRSSTSTSRPIGRTPRSNPATYTGLFTPIRELMAEVPMARERGYGPGRFSFNVAGGRCEACQGDGMVKVEMHFLPDVYVPCDVCAGKRYNRETLEVLYKGKNIAQILDLTVEAAHEFFKAVPTIARKLQTLLDVGLSLHQARPGRHHAVGRRGAARQAGAGTQQARHRPHALHPGRAHHRPALCRHRPAAQGAAPVARRGQHHRGDRAQPGRDQDRRLADRHGPRGRRRRRHGGGRRHAGRHWRPTRPATPGAIWRGCCMSRNHCRSGVRPYQDG